MKNDYPVDVQLAVFRSLFLHYNVIVSAKQISTVMHLKYL